LRIISHIYGSVLPLLVLGYIVFGNNVGQLFVPRHVSQLTETDFQILSQSLVKHHSATVATLEESFVACLPRSMENGTAKYYAEIYAYIITQNVEFRSQPDLPEIGSIERAEIEVKFNSDRNKSVEERSSAKIATLSSSQQTKLKEMDMEYGNAAQAVKWSNCAMTSAIKQLSTAGT
jgi:hypothetical protein